MGIDVWPIFQQFQAGQRVTGKVIETGFAPIALRGSAAPFVISQSGHAIQRKKIGRACAAQCGRANPNRSTSTTAGCRPLVGGSTNVPDKVVTPVCK